jgi:hypothetical protein
LKKLDVSWDGIYNSTGYLHSFAKSLACAVKNSPWPEYAEDIIATSGFAFRMWVNSGLCPSSTSNWNWSSQKLWVENSGLSCIYVEGGWAEDNIEKQNDAVSLIKTSIDNGVPAVAWCVGVPEWGLITGYDDAAMAFYTLEAFNGEGVLPYAQLGKGDIPVLSVLIITGMTDKPQEDVLCDTLKIASYHLKGTEQCPNPNGLEAYPALILHFESDYDPGLSWNLEYLIGTYGALKYYAWKYFSKKNISELAKLYSLVYEAWLEAFKIKKTENSSIVSVRTKIASLLRSAHENEIKALAIMDKSNK